MELNYQQMLLALMQKLTAAVETCRAAVDAVPSSRSSSDVQLLLDKHRVLLMKLPASLLPPENEIPDFFKRIVLNVWLKKVSDESDSGCSLLGYEACITYLSDYSPEYTLTLCTKLTDLLPENPDEVFEGQTGNALSRAAELAGVLSALKITLAVAKEKDSTIETDLGPRMQPLVSRCVMQYGTSSLILSRLSLLLLYCPTFVPPRSQDATQLDLDLLLIDAVANLRRIRVKTIDHMTNVSHLVYCIWNCSTVEQILRSLKAIYAIIASKDPSAHLSPALAHLLTLVPSNIVLQLAPHILQMPSCNSCENFKNTLSRLYIWLSGWPPAGDTLLLWQKTLVSIMVRNGMMRIVEEVACEVVPKLMTIVRLPAMRDRLLDALALLLVSCQSSSLAYRKCFECLVLWGEMLKKEDLSSPKPIHEKFSKMCQALMHLYPECQELNARLSELLTGFPEHSHAAVVQYVEDYDWAGQPAHAGVGAAANGAEAGLPDASVNNGVGAVPYLPSQVELPDSSIRPRTNSLPAGIDNIGSTCYYNAIIQALFATDTFRHAVVACQDTSCKPLSVVQELFSLLLFTEQDSIEPTKDMVRTAAPDYFEPGQQHDASEFLGHLLDTLKESEKNAIKSVMQQQHDSQERQFPVDDKIADHKSKHVEESFHDRDTNARSSIDENSQKLSCDASVRATIDTISTELFEGEPSSESVCGHSGDQKGRRDSAIDNMTDDAMDSTSLDCSRSQSQLESYKTDSYTYSNYYSATASSHLETLSDASQTGSMGANSQFDKMSSRDDSSVLGSQTDSRMFNNQNDSTTDSRQINDYMESSPIASPMVCGKFSVQTDSEQSINDHLDSDADLETHFKKGFGIGRGPVGDIRESFTVAASDASLNAFSGKDGEHFVRGQRHSSPKLGVLDNRNSLSNVTGDSKRELQASKRVKASLSRSAEVTRETTSVASVSAIRNDEHDSASSTPWATSCESDVQDPSNSEKSSVSHYGNEQIHLPDSQKSRVGCSEFSSPQKENLAKVFSLSSTSEHYFDGRPLKRKGSSFSSTGENDPQKSPRDDPEYEFSPSGRISSEKNTFSSNNSNAFTMNGVQNSTTEEFSSMSGWSASSSVIDMNDECKRDPSTSVTGGSSTTVTGDGTASDDNSDSGISIQDDLANSVLDTASTVGGVTEEEEVEGDEELTEISHVATDEEATANLEENHVFKPRGNPVSCLSVKEYETFVEKIFGGRSVRLTHCLNCKCISENYDDSFDFKVSFEDCAGKRDDLVSLDKLISHSLKKQELVGSEQYFCESCDSKQDAEIHTAIVKAPEFLILAQNRFIYNSSTNEENKILTQVDFDDHLELPVWNVSRLKERIRTASSNSFINTVPSCAYLGEPASSSIVHNKNSPTVLDSDSDSSKTASFLPSRTEELSLNLSESPDRVRFSSSAKENNDSGQKSNNEVSCDKVAFSESPNCDKTETASAGGASVPLKSFDISTNVLSNPNNKSSVQMPIAAHQRLDNEISTSELNSSMNVKDSSDVNEIAELLSTIKPTPSELASATVSPLETVSSNDNSYEAYSQIPPNPTGKGSEENNMDCFRNDLNSCTSEQKSSVLTESNDKARPMGSRAVSCNSAADKSELYACNEQNISPRLPDAVGKERYVLYAIVVHSGRISRAGHYFCYVRSSTAAAMASSLPNSEGASQLARGCGWVELNDNKAYATNFKDLKSSLTGCSRDCAPYLMFYQKVTGDAMVAPTRVEEELHSLPPHLQEAVRRHVHHHRVRGGRSKLSDSRGSADGGGAGGGGGARGPGGPQATGCGGGSALDVVRFIY